MNGEITTKPLSIGCVILAAGNAVRFGGDKLSVVLGGKSLLERALDAVPAEQFRAVAVVTQEQEKGGNSTAVRELVKRYGFTLLVNPRPEQGISRSVRIGMQSMTGRAVVRDGGPAPDHVLPPPCDAVLFQTADQPLLRQETVKKLVFLWRENPEKIAALSHSGVRGNPCIFPARFFPELLDLSGDRGGSTVIRRHPADLILLEADETELMDVDTREDLERIAQWIRETADGAQP